MKIKTYPKLHLFRLDGLLALVLLLSGYMLSIHSTSAIANQFPPDKPAMKTVLPPVQSQVPYSVPRSVLAPLPYLALPYSAMVPDATYNAVSRYSGYLAGNGMPDLPPLSPLPMMPPLPMMQNAPYYYPSYQQLSQQQNQQNLLRQPPPQINYKTPSYQLSKIMPFRNSFSPNDMFNNKNFPQPWTNAGQWNPWENGNNSKRPFFPAKQGQSDKKKAWGEERNIWSDFYTDFTEDSWDQGSNASYNMERMPGGWRAPSLSSPDPVTVSDAVVNQFPPMMEETGSMLNFSN